MKKLISTIGLGICGVILLIIIYNFTLFLIGYPISSDPDVVSTWIVKEKKDPAICYKINTGISIGPTSGTIRRLCVYLVAQKLKDPSACELLMPSDYGWNCLGAAQATADACSFDYGKNVAWRLGDDVNDPWENATVDQCKNNKVPSEQGKKCCYIYLLEKNPPLDACSRFKGDTKYMNTCLSELALRKKDQSLCTAITDANKKIICELQVKYAK